MKILHTADIHLKKYNDERWKVLQSLIELAEKEEADIFAISGDLFDKGIDAEGLRPKIRDVFSKNSFQVVIIPGNHDIESFRGGLYFGEDVSILNDLKDPYVLKDTRIWGFPFEPMDGAEIINKLQSVADKLSPDKNDILLYHGELLDAFYTRHDFGEEGKERYMPVKLSYFEDFNFDYILAGHFHSKFDLRQIGDNKYFVYPGSPVSITKRETGERKVNIFEVGKPPKEYTLSSPYFEKLEVELDPFSHADPLEVIRENAEQVPAYAKVILLITGYINSEKSKLNEEQLVQKIKEIDKLKNADIGFVFKDIQKIIENDLFKSFQEKLEKSGYDTEKKKSIRQLAIKAMQEVLL